MSQSRNLPATAIDSVLAFLLPLILPTLNDDHTAARDLALTMLAEYHPASVRELRLAAEAIGFSLQSLAFLAQSAAPDSPPYQREADAKSACTLNRSSHQSQRRLTEIQRDARMASPSEPLTTAPSQPAPPPPSPSQPGPSQPDPSPDTPPLTVAAAEAQLTAATKLLNLMQAHAPNPPPHSPLAQQIQAQQRVVQTARMKLQQARRQHANPSTGAEPAAA